MLLIDTGDTVALSPGSTQSLLAVLWASMVYFVMCSRAMNIIVSAAWGSKQNSLAPAHTYSIFTHAKVPRGLSHCIQHCLEFDD